MNITVYAIGGKWSPGPSGDCPVGTAHDDLTFTSLLDLVETKSGYAVSLHGTVSGKDDYTAISGEYSLADARNLVKILKILHPLVRGRDEQKEMRGARFENLTAQIP
jgi:hypothetical protein